MSTPAAPDEVRARLDACSSVPATAEVAMDICLEHGYELPSIYLERGGRLRCLAHRGYWQVFDGLAPGAGMLGTAYAQGTTRVAAMPEEHDYIRAVPAVVSGVYAPIAVGERTAGVLSVEARTAMDSDDVAWIEQLARDIGRRLDELGGPPVEEPSEKLARFTYQLACLDDRDQVMRQALEAAMAMSDMRGACLFLGEGADIAPVADSGGLGRFLATLGEKDVGQLAEYVSRATSSYAVGVGEGDGFEATHVLRDRGVVSLVVLALTVHGRREGMLVLVDEGPRPGIVTLMPLLEMLAATSAAMIAAAKTRDSLQRSRRILAHQLRHDPLTGLVNRSGLLEQMNRELDTVDRRAGAVVLFVDLDGFKEVNDRHGHRSGDLLLAAVADRLRHAARDSDLVARIGGDEFVVLCTGVSGLEEATRVGQRILERLADPFRLGEVSVGVTACIGIAAAGARESAEDVIAAADRAMYAAKALGPGRWAVADIAS